MKREDGVNDVKMQIKFFLKEKNIRKSYSRMGWERWNIREIMKEQTI